MHSRRQRLTPSSSGPLISYIALCPKMECRKLEAKDAKWAKIDEVSIRDDKTWAQEDLGELLFSFPPPILSLPLGHDSARHTSSLLLAISPRFTTTTY